MSDASNSTLPRIRRAQLRHGPWRSALTTAAVYALLVAILPVIFNEGGMGAPDLLHVALATALALISFDQLEAAAPQGDADMRPGWRQRYDHGFALGWTTMTAVLLATHATYEPGLGLLSFGLPFLLVFGVFTAWWTKPPTAEETAWRRTWFDVDRPATQQRWWDLLLLIMPAVVVLIFVLNALQVRTDPAHLDWTFIMMVLMGGIAPRYDMRGPAWRRPRSLGLAILSATILANYVQIV